MISPRFRFATSALLERRGAEAYVGMLVIEPARQGAGLGTQMIDRLETAARDLWQSAAMTMVVINLRKPLIEWYGRRGYEPTGASHDFPVSPSTGETRRDFHLVELRKAL